MTRSVAAAVLVQFVRYAACGALSALVHIAVLVMLVELFRMPSTLASAVGFACAIPVNYLLQHRFVFSRDGSHLSFFSRYFAVTLLSMGLNVVLHWLFTVVLGLYYVLGQILALGVVVLVNFAVNRHFTFGPVAGAGQARI